jgi:hypothetical protein
MTNSETKGEGTRKRNKCSHENTISREKEGRRTTNHEGIGSTNFFIVNNRRNLRQRKK